jgi:hypothetical protein
MRLTLVLLSLVVGGTILLSHNRSGACGGDFVGDAISVVSDDAAARARAIANLRAAGPAGLKALFVQYQSAIDRHRADPAHPEAMWDRLSAALDAVAAQKDAWASGLYWYTDLAEAERAAKAADKPILSLRLLGTLDTELSCANSRFFRTVLYPDATVGNVLRSQYILHWQTYRPVPKLTIDFGDGRKIERTITGNSVHYVLTPDGRVVDAIPGLYGPVAFLRALNEAHLIEGDWNEPDFANRLVTYHTKRLADTRFTWDADLRNLGVADPALPKLTPVNAKGQPAPTAAAGARITASKALVEIRPIVALTPDRQTLAARTDDAVWAKLAALHAEDAHLDNGSRAVIYEKAGAVAANRLTTSKWRVEDPTLRMIRNFERSVAEDTVRNEYLFHSQIHEWFIQNQVPAKLEELNDKVYAELFLMPKSDPWLGLVPADTYTALRADGATR